VWLRYKNMRSRRHLGKEWGGGIKGGETGSKKEEIMSWRGGEEVSKRGSNRSKHDGRRGGRKGEGKKGRKKSITRKARRCEERGGNLRGVSWFEESCWPPMEGRRGPLTQKSEGSGERRRKGGCEGREGVWIIKDEKEREIVAITQKVPRLIQKREQELTVGKHH